MNIQMAMGLGRSLVAFIIATTSWAIIPLYGMPFGGCTITSTELGCSDWPEILRGVIFMAVLLVIGPSSRIHLVASAIALLLITALGGPATIRSGEHFGFESIESLAWQAQHGTEFFLGGLVGAIVILVFRWGWILYQPKEGFG